MTRSQSVPETATGILIVGGGLAGLFAALKLAPLPVTVLTTAPLGEGASSAWAQGGIAAAMSVDDTFDKHVADTIEAGAGIVDEDVARAVVSQGPDRIHDLLALGVPFDRDLAGKLMLSREAAHSEHRVVRVKGDMAGRAIMAALVAAVRRTPSITLMEEFEAEELIVTDGKVRGVVARPAIGSGRERIALHAAATVLCTGGIGHLYAVTTNPEQACGEGIGMAARAGALIADPEFVQYHPTAIDIGRDPAPLATEALRGEGAHLVNRAGERFMLALHPDGELAPRDIVARGVFAEVMSNRGAFLDCRTAIGSHFAEEFPSVYASCMSAGIDPVTAPIPVVPAVHYHMGGIAVDLNGRTSLPGLWAAGEVTATGIHGANRLASNSLLEAAVFAAQIASDIAASLSDKAGPIATSALPDNVADPTITGEADRIALLRQTMSADVGVIRNAEGLKHALSVVAALEKEPASASFANMLVAAKLITAAAWLRRESRGGHFRSDFPKPLGEWKHRTFLTLAEADAAREKALAPRNAA
ncbi:L-aspartate oxidase [Rhizobium alvei]|uniref:L-aspartate oxidase n=1 Tax=Rhizobium alvei TaxID=1132659 RepID=A0ABT8YGJ2_9HYPH|nr:L-aspartate oxidase [Rhizobium alvei]MDO6962793.1 L-aspartate oxidase [Rhizobium alvei]